MHDRVHVCMHVCSIQIISRVLTPKATADSIQNCLLSLLLGKTRQAFVEDFSSNQKLLVGIFFCACNPTFAERFNLLIGLTLY